MTILYMENEDHSNLTELLKLASSLGPGTLEGPMPLGPSSGLPLAIPLLLGQDVYGNKRICPSRAHAPQAPTPDRCETAEFPNKMALNAVLGPS